MRSESKVMMVLSNAENGFGLGYAHFPQRSRGNHAPKDP